MALLARKCPSFPQKEKERKNSPKELDLLRSLDHDLAGDAGFGAFSQLQGLRSAGRKPDDRHFARYHIPAFVETSICNRERETEREIETPSPKVPRLYISICRDKD